MRHHLVVNYLQCYIMGYDQWFILKMWFREVSWKTWKGKITKMKFWKSKTLFCLHPQHSLFLRHFPIRFFPLGHFRQSDFSTKYLRDMMDLQSYKIYQLIRGMQFMAHWTWENFVTVTPYKYRSYANSVRYRHLLLILSTSHFILTSRFFYNHSGNMSNFTVKMYYFFDC